MFINVTNAHTATSMVSQCTYKKTT